MEAVPGFLLEFYRNIIYIEIIMTDTDANISKKVGWFQKTVLVMLSLFTILLIVFYFGFWRVPDRTKEAEALIAEHDAMVNRMSSIPPEKNAWTYYEKAADGLDLSVCNKKIEYFNNQIADTENLVMFNDQGTLLTTADMAISINRGPLELCDRAFKEEKTFANVSNSKNMVFSIPNPGQYDKIYQLSGFLILNGMLETKRSNFNLAAKRYFQVIFFIESFQQSRGCPSLIIENAENAILNLITLTNAEKDNRQLLSYILKRSEKIILKACDFEIEIVRFLKRNNSYFRTNNRYNSAPNEPFYFIKDWFLNKRENREAHVIQNIILQMKEYSEKPYPQAIAAMNKIKIPYTYHKSSGSGTFEELKLNYKQTVWLRTNFNAVRLLSALHLYRLDNGKYPDTLALLSLKYLEKIPGDQFSPDGKFVYKKRKDDSVILYSVGSDMKDDGGLIIAGKAEDSGDIVFFDSAKAGVPHKVKDNKQIKGTGDPSNNKCIN